MLPESNCPAVLEVTVCGFVVGSLLTHMMVLFTPTTTVMDCGVK